MQGRWAPRSSAATSRTAEFHVPRQVLLPERNGALCGCGHTARSTPLPHRCGALALSRLQTGSRAKCPRRPNWGQNQRCLFYFSGRLNIFLIVKKTSRCRYSKIHKTCRLWGFEPHTLSGLLSRDGKRCGHTGVARERSTDTQWPAACSGPGRPQCPPRNPLRRSGGLPRTPSPPPARHLSPIKREGAGKTRGGTGQSCMKE